MSSLVGPSSWRNPYTRLIYRIPVLQDPELVVVLETILSKN